MIFSSHIVGSTVSLQVARVAMTNAGKVPLTPPPAHEDAPIPLLPFSFASLRLVGEDTPPLLSDTCFTLSGRLRYEFWDMDGREDSNALTRRQRAGIKTSKWLGFSALGELKHTLDFLGEDRYNPFPRADRTLISDPSNMELNRLQAQYSTDAWDTTITAGRQEITLEDQRFVGNVGWHQNAQTCDAVRLETSPFNAITLNYAYLSRINRIFGEQVPQTALNHRDSDSHLINLRYDGLECSSFTAFAYNSWQRA